MCKFHFYQAIQPKLYNKELVPKYNSEQQIPHKFKEYFNIKISSFLSSSENKIRDIIKYDIKILEILPSKELYLAYLKIVLPFWKYFALKFHDYFWKTYLDLNNENCLSGWQNFIKGVQPGTNNALEGTNHAIKEDVVENKKLEFGFYLESLCEDLSVRSETSGKLACFPKTPPISSAVLRFARKLCENFEEYFLYHEGKYYIKDKIINYSLYNSNTGKTKKNLNSLGSKISKGIEEATTHFLSYYSKPTLNEIKRLDKCKEIAGKIQILKLLSIRQITIVEI